MTRPVVLALLVLTLAGALATKPASAYLLRSIDTDPQEEPC